MNTDGTHRQLCTFGLAGRRLAIPTKWVAKVVLSRECVPVPRTPEAVTGLLDLRGQIVTAIDLHRRLGLGTPRSNADRSNVIVRYDGGLYSLQTDEIGEMIEIDTDSLQPVPTTLEPPLPEMLESIFEFEEEWLFILDLEALLDL